jgi:hypothetical protein
MPSSRGLIDKSENISTISTVEKCKDEALASMIFENRILRNARRIRR